MEIKFVYKISHYFHRAEHDELARQKKRMAAAAAALGRWAHLGFRGRMMVPLYVRGTYVKITKENGYTVVNELRHRRVENNRSEEEGGPVVGYSVEGRVSVVVHGVKADGEAEAVADALVSHTYTMRRFWWRVVDLELQEITAA